MNSAAFDAARAICRRHARSLYFSSFFLPRPKRNAAYAVYAFCRLLDDATDEAENPADVERQIERFCELLDEVYSLRFSTSMQVAATPASPLSSISDRGRRRRRSYNTPAEESRLALVAFEATVKQYDIPKNYFVEIAEGCRMDLTVMRYQTWEDLQKYCYRVAGVVGLIMSQIFGLADASARAQAIAMGEAMQLTNILRDVKEDFDRGRIYLPQEDLDKFGYTEQDLAGNVVNKPFVRLMQFEIDRARQLYRSGAAGLRHLTDDGSRFTATSMGVIYAGILRAIERQKYDVFSARARLTLPQKLLRLPAARRLSRSPGTVPDVF